MKNKIDILIDFDGTVVTHAFPKIGESVGAEKVLRALTDQGHKLILFTMRCDSIRGAHLTAAVEWFKERNIPLYGIQTNPRQSSWTTSPKAYGQLIIDDTALGIPLVNPKGERPYVDWAVVENLLKWKGLLPYQSEWIDNELDKLPY